MARKRTRQPDFTARIEQLEDRRVMSADAVGGLFAGVEHHDWLDAPPLVQTIVTPADPPPVDQHLLADPDFWIDPGNSAALDGYFQEVEQALAEAHQQTGLLHVRNNYGFTGRGQTVAVIDSGIA